MPITTATTADVPQLYTLVNNAYRGDESKKGWTTESHLLDGLRIDADTLLSYFTHPAITILKNTDGQGNLTGCVYLEQRSPKLYVGMFSVLPALQGQGTGRELLLAAEDFARQNNCHTLTMTVISIRHELISWYRRRGYELTGEIVPFHVDKKFGVPNQHIELVVLEKSV